MTIIVSTGKPKVDVPGVVGQQATDAVAALTAKRLKADVHRVNSDKETGTVTGQDPKRRHAAWSRATKVRINVSQGPKPVPIPPVVGSPYESAASTLQGAGFAVARRDVESNEPKGVVQQDPAANSVVAPGTTVTLFVSKGPKVAAVPDVTSFSRADAIATLRNSGFKVRRRQSATRPTRPRTASSSSRRPAPASPPSRARR